MLSLVDFNLSTNAWFYILKHFIAWFQFCSFQYSYLLQTFENTDTFSLVNHIVFVVGPFEGFLWNKKCFLKDRLFLEATQKPKLWSGLFYGKFIVYLSWWFIPVRGLYSVCRPIIRCQVHVVQTSCKRTFFHLGAIRRLSRNDTWCRIEVSLVTTIIMNVNGDA